MNDFITKFLITINSFWSFFKWFSIQPIFYLWVFLILILIYRLKSNKNKNNFKNQKKKNTKNYFKDRYDIYWKFFNKEYLGFENHKKEIFELIKIIQAKYENNEMEDFIYDKKAGIYYYNTDLDIYVPCFVYKKFEKSIKNYEYINKMVIISNIENRNMLNYPEYITLNSLYSVTYRSMLYKFDYNIKEIKDNEDVFNLFYYSFYDFYLEKGLVNIVKGFLLCKEANSINTRRTFSFLSIVYGIRIVDLCGMKMKNNIIKNLFTKFRYVIIRWLFNEIRFAIVEYLIICNKRYHEKKLN